MRRYEKMKVRIHAEDPMPVIFPDFFSGEGATGKDGIPRIWFVLSSNVAEEQRTAKRGMEEISLHPAVSMSIDMAKQFRDFLSRLIDEAEAEEKVACGIVKAN